MKNRVGRNRGKRRLILCVALLCAIMLFATACSSEAEENSQSQTPNASSEQREPNEASPSLLGEFESVDLEGNTVDESILADHQLTMINVWATFCGPCINEMPDLAKIHQEYGDKGFQIVGIVGDVVNMDGSLSEENVQLAHQIIDTTGANYTHLLPTSDLSPILSQVTAYPQTFFVDSNGNQVGTVYIGSRDKEGWQEVIDGLLSQTSQGASGTAQNSGGSAGENGLAQGVDVCKPTGTVGEQTPFAEFIAWDMGGQKVSEEILKDDDIVLALLWNPEWEQSGQTLDKVQEYLEQTADVEANGAIGVLVDWEEGERNQAMEIVDKQSAIFPQIIPQGDLKQWVDQKQLTSPKILLIAPWGELVGELDVEGDMGQWSQQINDAVYQMYLGCAS